MFPNYFPVAFRIKQVVMFPIWGWLVPLGCPKPWAGESWWPGEQSLLCATAPSQGCLWTLPAEETCSSSLPLPCQQSKGMFNDGLVPVTLRMFGPHFGLGKGEGTGRGEAICGRYFSTIWSLCLCFCFSKFLFSWVSLCFICLFILYANYFHALVNLWSKYCRALNVKLNLTSLRSCWRETVAINFLFPILHSLQVFDMEK